MTPIDIADMPVDEKLRLMEALWDSLSANAGSEISSPAWHRRALQQAEGELAQGSAHFLDWADAKNRLRGYRQA